MVAAGWDPEHRAQQKKQTETDRPVEDIVLRVYRRCLRFEVLKTRKKSWIKSATEISGMTKQIRTDR